MKSTTLKLAMAGALSLAGMQAMAGLVPADIDGTVKYMYVGGATATNGLILNVMKVDTASYCVAGTLSIFTATNQVVYFCRANFSGTGVALNDKIAILKESNGGSANGVHNPAAGASLAFIDFRTGTNNIAATCGAAVPTAAAPPYAAFDTYSCSASVNLTLHNGVGTGASVAPTVGISDVDPATFVGIGGVTADDVAKFSGTNGFRSGVGVTFNPIVSTSLYLALQKAQGLSNAGAEDLTSVAKIPTVTSAMIRGIFTQQAFLADQLVSNGVVLTTQTAAADGLIHICRRGNTSGTMTSFKLNYLGEGCTKNAATVTTFALPENSDEAAGSVWGATHNTDLVFAGAGSGDVRNCVNFHSSAGNYAVGVASTEAKPAKTGASNVYRYVKVDGAEPSLKSVMEGRYDFFTENSFNLPTSGPNAASTTTQTMFNFLYGLMSNPTELSKVNSAWKQATCLDSADNGTCDTGLLVIPSGGNGTATAPTFPIAGTGPNSVQTKPINSQRRQAPGLGANNCNRTYQAYPTFF